MKKAKEIRMLNRTKADSPNRFLTQPHMSEIRRAVAVTNSRARRAGKTPQGPKITLFSCRCNCFYIDVG